MCSRLLVEIITKGVKLSVPTCSLPLSTKVQTPPQSTYQRHIGKTAHQMEIKVCFKQLLVMRGSRIWVCEAGVCRINVTSDKIPPQLQYLHPGDRDSGCDSLCVHTCTYTEADIIPLCDLDYLHCVFDTIVYTILTRLFFYCCSRNPFLWMPCPHILTIYVYLHACT